MSDLIPEAEYEKLIARATELGLEHGTSAGSWVDVPDAETARRFIDLDGDGDPAWDDAIGYRSPLSGEFDGDLTPAALLRELDAPPLEDEEEHGVLCAYEEGHVTAYRDEVLRMANVQLD